MQETAEEKAWSIVEPDDLWVLDKLILSKKLGYTCGPVGIDVPTPGEYIVRPCVNPIGLGLGAQKIYIEKSTDTLPIGYFWCEFFHGRHLSVDYQFGEQKLCVEGLKDSDTFTHWNSWIKVDDKIPLPKILEHISKRYEWINCEFIDGKLIEVHLRHNQDFEGDITYFIPVWSHERAKHIPLGYTYREYPDLHGRVGAFVK
jgi:hypothetical protein